MKRTEETTAKHLSFTASSLHFLQRKAFVLPLCSGRRRGLSFALLLAVLWLVGIPVGAKSITTVSPQPNVVSAADTSMVAYTEKKTCAKIPSAYKNKIDSVLKENLPVIELNGTNSWSFTTDFVIKEMKSDWGISKDNQLMFIWDNICKQLTGRYACDNKDSNTLNDFRIAVKNVRSCGQRYKDGIMPFIEKQIAENKQQIAENKQQIAANEQQIAANEQQIAANEQQIAANEQQIAANEQQIAANEQQIAENEQQIAENEQQIAENIKEIMRLDSIGIKNMVSFYQKRDKLTDAEKSKLSDGFKQLIKDCRIRGIDHIKILLAEVKVNYPNLKEAEARRKVDDMLKYWE